MQSTQIDRRGISILSLGHMINDISQGGIPALFPFLILERGLSYTSVSGIILAVTLISSVLQPLLGTLSDRKPISWLVPLGMVAGGLGFGLMGIVPGYWLLIAAAILCGAGVATFHPESFRFANYLSHERKATGTSFFTVGGNLGFAIGPIVVTFLAINFGLQGMAFMVIPTSIMAFVIWRELPRLDTFRPMRTTGVAANSGKRSDWKSFSRLTIVIVLRASLYYGMATFAPLYLINARHVPIASANSAISLMALAGAAGTLTCGFLADRFGYKRVLLFLLAPLAPLIAGFLLASGPFEILCLALFGFAHSASFTVAIVMGQEYASENIGVASGISTGFAIGLGGLTTPIYGAIADAYGLSPVFYVMVIVPLLAIAMAVTLPAIYRKHPKMVIIPADLAVENAAAQDTLVK